MPGLGNKFAGLARKHGHSRDPFNPYNQGIGVLFNGDAWLRGSAVCPRQDWLVISPYVLVETGEAKQDRVEVVAEALKDAKVK